MFEYSNYKDVLIARGISSSGINIYLYVVDGLLIDSGPEIMAEDSKPFFYSNAINQVVLTHLHEDHSGMASWLEQNLRVPIYLHPCEVPAALKQAEHIEYHHLVWGERMPFHAMPMPKIISTGKYTYEVFDTPGHVKYHNVLFERNQGWLFSGDLYVSPKLKVCFFEENMKHTIATIGNLLELDFDTIFCAHAGVVENGKAMLQSKFDFLKELQEKVNVLRRQGLTDHEIDKELYPRIPAITEMTEGEWSSYHMISTI